MVQQRETVVEERAAAAATPLLVSVPEAARLLGIGATFAWELVHEGTIPSIKLGRRVLVPRHGLERLFGKDLWVATDRDEREET